MGLTAAALKYLSYTSLLIGCILSATGFAPAATAFLCSIAFAHVASVLRNHKHVADMEETLGIVLELAKQAREKCDAGIKPDDLRDGRIPGENGGSRA